MTEGIPEDGGIVLIDAGCDLCRRAQGFVISHAPRDRFRFEPLDSDEGRAWLGHCGLPPTATGSMVLVTREGCYTESEAVLRVARRMAFPYRLAAVGRVLPRALRDPVYRCVARHRHKLARG